MAVWSSSIDRTEGKMAFFEGLVVGADGQLVSVAEVAGKSYYVIDDEGFRRHIDARDIDRTILEQFITQIADNREEAAGAVLRMLGQDDLFTKAMVDSALSRIDVEQILDRELPADARQMLGMMGFRIVINRHGEIVRLEMPEASSDWDEEP